MCGLWRGIWIIGFGAVSFGGDLTQPVARKTDHSEIYHGVRIEDPYIWLEDMESEEVKRWVLGQDAYARQYVKKYAGRDWVGKRLAEVGSLVRYFSPSKAGDRYFYIEHQPGIGWGNVWMKPKKGQARVILDRGSLGEGRTLVFAAPDGTGRYLLYVTSSNGTRWGRIGIRDLEKGEDLPETLNGFHSSFTTVTWEPDGSGFYYDRVAEPDSGADSMTEPEPMGLFFHRIGTPQQTDEKLFSQPDDRGWLFTHSFSGDGRYLVLQGRNEEKRRAYIREKGKGGFRMLFEVEGPIGFLDAYRNEFYFFLNHGAPRGRVVAISTEGEKPWRTVVPEGEDTLVSAAMEDGTLVLTYRKDALPVLRAFRADGSRAFSIELPAVAAPGVSTGQPGDGEMFVSLSNLTDPGSLWKLSLKTGALTRFLSPKTGHDPDRFVTRQVFFDSKDGTRIPMFLVHRKDMAAQGKHPLFMYGFGSGNWAAFPWYQSHLVVWLEMGGVYAMPNIRGGGEYGKEWHHAGIKGNKQNAIDDFIAAARWLIREGYTTPQRLVINGGSASGPLVGAAIVQAPELFAATLIEWPALDMIRFEKYPGGRYWTWGNGSPSNEQDFHSLRAWSPYHNLKRDVCYPPTLLIVGEKDQGTIPPHAYKFQAALQEAMGCDHPALMRMIWSGGHYQYGLDLADSRETWTDLLSFLGGVVGMEPGVSSGSGGR